MGYFFGKDTGDRSARITPGTTIPLSRALAGSQSGATPSNYERPTAAGILGSPTPGKRWDRDNEWERPRDRRGGIIIPPKPPEEPIEALGEWQWPEEMRDLYGLLYGRAGDLLMKEPGFSQDVLDVMFGRNFEKVRGQEKGARDLLQQNLASQGMLGTGTETEAMKDLAWGTEANVGDIMSNVFLANEAQKRQDISQFTQLASQLFGQSMDYQTTQEALNAQRRNEANQMLAMMLSLFGAGQGSGGG